MPRWRVIPEEENLRRGRITGPLFDAPCALGKCGTVPVDEGREGDGKTPLGIYPFRRVFYRADREEAPVTSLPVTPISADLGWCDDPESEHYNRLVRLPFGPGHEKLWQEDHLYDLILVIGHNDAPVVPGYGSAVFVHVAREGFEPTLGCVALEASALRRMLRMLEPDDQLQIG